MALIKSNPSQSAEAAGFTVCEKTGDYFNRYTQHRAWFERGSQLPPGYEPDDAEESPDLEAEHLDRAIQAELEATREARDAAQKLADENALKLAEQQSAAADEATKAKAAAADEAAKAKAAAQAAAASEKELKARIKQLEADLKKATAAPAD